MGFVPSVVAFDKRLQSPTPVEELASDFAQVIHLIRGRRALEIGGPSDGHTPFQGIYDPLATCDNVVHPDQHEVFAKNHAGSNFIVRAPASGKSRRLGQIFRLDGARLGRLGNGSYDLIFACHVLEHFRDPISALHAWDRVLAPGGLMFVVLPWHQRTLDRFRTPHTMQHLLRRHALGHWKGPPQADPDFEQIIRCLDYEGTPGGIDNVNVMRERVLRDRGGAELLHWHVFDFDLLSQLFWCFSYDIKYIGLWEPYHQVLIASKPR